MLCLGCVAVVTALCFFAAWRCRASLSRGLGARLVRIGGALLLGFLFGRGFFSDGFVTVLPGGEFCGTWYERRDVWATLARWGLAFAEILATASALSGTALSRKVEKWAGVPVTLLSLADLPALLSYATEYLGENFWDHGFFLPPVLRVVLIGAELTLTLLLPLVDCFVLHPQETLSPAEKKRAVWFGLIAWVCAMPFLTPGSLFGTTSVVVGIGHPLQFLWIASIVAGVVLMWLAFRGADDADKWLLLTYLVVTLVLHYNSIYTHGFKMARAPMQLCNLATYLLLVLLFCRRQGLFDFILVANCPGCVIAIATVTEDSPLFGFWAMHYFVQHTLVFLIPLLMLMLGLFRLPDTRAALRHYFIGFTLYFGTCLLLDGLETGFVTHLPGINTYVFNDANYFYLRDCPVDALGGLFRALQFGPFRLWGCTFWCGYVLFIFAAFSLLALGCFGLTRAIAHLCGRVAVRREARRA